MNKNKKIIFSIIAVVIVVAGVWLGVAKNKANTTPQVSEPIKIGAILPLTGEGASYGDVW